MISDRTRKVLLIVCSIVGLLYGLVLGLFALGAANGGHGWYGPFPGALSIFAIPLTTSSFFVKTPSVRIALAKLGLIGAVLIDLLCVLVAGGETKYFQMLYKHDPSGVWTWFGLMVIWLIIALIAMIAAYFASKKKA